MAHSAGSSGPIPRSRFEAPDVHLINSRFWGDVTYVSAISGYVCARNGPFDYWRLRTDPMGNPGVAFRSLGAWQNSPSPRLREHSGWHNVEGDRRSDFVRGEGDRSVIHVRGK